MKADELNVDDEKPKNCFKRKSRLVKCLAILLIIILIVLVALFIQLVIRKDEYSCNSELCIKVSADLTRYISPNIDPCDDYHSFICENFIKDHKELPLPTVTEQLNAMIAEPLNFDDPRPFVMQKLFYQSCANLGAIEEDQEDSITDLFERLGGWPILRGSNWNLTDYYWVDFIVQLRNFGLKFEWFLDFDVYMNDTGESYLKIGIPSYLKPVGSDMRHYRKELFTDVAVFMGAPNSIAHYEVSKTIDFEDDLGILADKFRYDNTLNESLKINEVQLVWQNILWLELINNVTKSGLTEYDRIVFGSLEYIQQLHKLLMGTPKRIQVDFMLWKIIEEFWPYLSRPIRDRFERYNLEILREQPELNRQKFCVNETKNQFPLVAESVFIRKHITREKVTDVIEIASNVQQQFIKHLEGASWMNRELRRRALEKIQGVQFIVGGPQDIFDEPRFYQRIGIFGFEFQSVKILTMLRERTLRFFDEYYGNLKDRFSRSPEQLSFFFQAINVTHFTIVNNNSLVIPIAMLQNTFYNPDLPNYLNYATLGKSIAQQLFNFVYQSNETADEWTSNAFDSVIHCLMQEASGYSEFRKSKILKENLADFAAIDVAYQAYSEWSRRHTQELLIPGLKYSPGQIFWLHSSKFMCTKIFDRRDRDFARFKVAEALRHSRHFGDQYNCAVGSRMSPRRKCKVL